MSLSDWDNEWIICLQHEAAQPFGDAAQGGVGQRLLAGEDGRAAVAEVDAVGGGDQRQQAGRVAVGRCGPLDTRALVRNVVISDPATIWSDADYETAIGGLYEPNSLTEIAVTLINPGAEDGTIGWTDEVGSLATRASNPAPYTGVAYFSGGSNAATKARQRLDLATATGLTTAEIDGGGLWGRLAWRQASFGGTDDDVAGAGLRFLDGAPTQLVESVAAKAEIFPEKQWLERGHSVEVPSGARNVDVLMDFTRASGTNLDGYFDDITLRFFRQ